MFGPQVRVVGEHELVQVLAVVGGLHAVDERSTLQGDASGVRRDRRVPNHSWRECSPRLARGLVEEPGAVGGDVAEHPVVVERPLSTSAYAASRFTSAIREAQNTSPIEGQVSA